MASLHCVSVFFSFQSMVDQSDDSTTFGDQYTKEINAILGMGNEHLYPDILRLVLADLMHYCGSADDGGTAMNLS